MVAKYSAEVHIVIYVLKLFYCNKLFQAKMKKNKTGSSDGDKSSAKELNPAPSYIAERLTIWDNLKAKYESEIASKSKQLIKVTLPDGKELEATAWETTAYDIAKSIRYFQIIYLFIYFS